LADISKINAVLLANIAEIDDVLAANIAKVNGLVFSTAPAFTGLLDTYTGAAAAFSTRRLYGQYTGAAMRVRRDSDDTEQDIGFDSNGDLDTSALATFVGSGNNGYVTKWYGQESSGGTGSGNDAAQATSGSQPQIYNGTAVITENGKPAIDFDGASQQMLELTSNVTCQTLILVTKIGTGSIDMSWNSGGDNSHRSLNGNYVLDNTGINDWFNENNGDSYIDGTQVTGRPSGTTQHIYFGWNSTPGFAFGQFSVDANIGGSQRSWDGPLQETILYTNTTYTDSTNRGGIEGNVNAHFQIGNFGTPTSGLLYDYSGAAAAYSVRQLANTAALAMRIREDGTDTETDIGFDSNGDLATADIAAFCGSNNGYVVRWYDQSGNQNDATQGTSGSQPQIYNGTAVIALNGKSAVASSGNTANGFMLIDNTGFNINNLACFAVGSSDSLNTSEQKPWITLGAVVDGAGWYQGWAGKYYYGSQTIDVFGSGQAQTQVLTGIIASTGQSTVYARTVGIARGTWTPINQTVGTTIDVGLGHYDQLTAYTDDSHKWQEVIIWESDQYSNISGIESNINGYFSIY